MSASNLRRMRLAGLMLGLVIVAGPASGEGLQLVRPLQFAHLEVRGYLTDAKARALLDQPLEGEPLVLEKREDSGQVSPANWVEVRTCAEWLARTDEGLVPIDNLNNGRDLTFRMTCGVLAAAQVGRPAKVSDLPQDPAVDLGRYSPIYLGAPDAETAAQQKDAEQIAQLAARGLSIGDLGRLPGRLAVIAPDGVARRFFMDGDANEDPADHPDIYIDRINSEPTDAHFSYRGNGNAIAVLARGDFTGTGREDFLVRYVTRPWAGTIVGGSLDIVSAVRPDGTIQRVGCVDIFPDDDARCGGDLANSRGIYSIVCQRGDKVSFRLCKAVWIEP